MSITIGKLKKLLNEWPDDSPIDIWLTAFDNNGNLRGPPVSGRVREVLLQVEAKSPDVVVADVVVELSFDDGECW